MFNPQHIHELRTRNILREDLCLKKVAILSYSHCERFCDIAYLLKRQLYIRITYQRLKIDFALYFLFVRICYLMSTLLEIID